MKVLFVANGKIFTDEEMTHLNKKQLGGFKRVSGSSFIFDVSGSASLLADLQNYCHGQYIGYNLFYFDKEPVMFAYP